ncbi:hypothetical protein CsatB_028205 [Cannabis sativa]
MAPTAAMLILSNTYRSSNTSCQASTQANATFSGLKISVLKWVSEHNPISKPKSDEKGWESFIDNQDHNHEATIKNRFKEALDITTCL